MIPSPFRQPLRQMLRYADHPSLASAQVWPLGEAMAVLAAPKHPPILLVSMPRSGSSWAGRILGSSERSLYLHEPLTQSYLGLVGKGTSWFEYDACKHKGRYDHFASLTFRGVPRFKERVVLFPEQWSMSRRGRSRLVIKEINPLVLDIVIERFRPRIIYLLRHPAAVAHSFQSLGWDGEQFGRRFTKATLSELERRYHIPYEAEFWEQSGALQAIIQNKTMEVLSSAGDYTVVKYEDICADPVGEFSRLFDFCDLPFSLKNRREIKNTSHSDTGYGPGRYDVERNSKAMIDRWKSDVSCEKVDLLRKGYFANHPLFYTEEADW